MITSMRGRLAALVAVALGVGVAAGAAMVVALLGVPDADAQLRVAIIVGGATLVLVVAAAAIVLVHRAFAPLSMLARASREVAQGRHPTEAFGDTPLTGELGDVARGMSALALRLREIDATDRRFLMSISHELRTPLTAITGHAQAIGDFPDDALMREQSLGVIHSEAERLERLIEDIVDLARLRSNRFTTVTEGVWLDELGEHLLAIFDDGATSLEGGGDVRVTGKFEHVMLHSDGQRILQVLRNLVGNALRYARSFVHVEAARVSGHILISVTNDGPTISEADRMRIFEPFVGTKREGGLGLGLAIGRELAWALGGNLDCVAREDGARFELTLPLEPPGYGR